MQDHTFISARNVNIAHYNGIAFLYYNILKLKTWCHEYSWAQVMFNEKIQPFKDIDPYILLTSANIVLSCNSLFHFISFVPISYLYLVKSKQKKGR